MYVINWRPMLHKKCIYVLHSWKTRFIILKNRLNNRYVYVYKNIGNVQPYAKPTYTSQRSADLHILVVLFVNNMEKNANIFIKLAPFPIPFPKLSTICRKFSITSQIWIAKLSISKLSSLCGNPDIHKFISICNTYIFIDIRYSSFNPSNTHMHDSTFNQ